MKYALYTYNKYGHMILIKRHWKNARKLSPFGVEPKDFMDAALFDTKKEAEQCARDNDCEHLLVCEVNVKAEITL